MLTFDKIKIVTYIQNIKDINHNYFKTISQGDYIRGYRYSKKTPYTLIIDTNNEKGELVIEFTAKVLLDKYPKLINKDTIRECFDNINRLDICTLDTDAILNASNVVKCDVTKDFDGNIKDIKNYIRQNLANYRKWTAEYHQGSGGIIVKKTATTDAKRFVIYDKGSEMWRKTNAAFLSTLTDKERTLDYFKGKVRFEINSKSVAMTKKLLQIPTTDLADVLNATANPFKTILDEALTQQTEVHPVKSLRDYERYLLLKEYDFDMEAVTEKVRSLISKNTSITKSLEPYRQLCQQMQPQPLSASDLRSTLTM